MTLQTSGLIDMTDIVQEWKPEWISNFQDPNFLADWAVSDFYAGGSIVPSGTTGTYGAVPSSGTISLKNFYGTNSIATLSTTITVGNPSGTGVYGYLEDNYGSIGSEFYDQFIIRAADYFPNPNTSYSPSTRLIIRNDLTIPQIDADNDSDDVWKTMTINGTNFTRSNRTSFTATTVSVGLVSVPAGIWYFNGTTNYFGTTVGASKSFYITQ
jgi:hypothetical protein